MSLVIGTENTTSNTYPWHQQAWQSIAAYQKADRMPHALLLWGQRGLAKKAFASSLAKQLLCGRQDGAACGQCQSCHWFEQGTHPDLISITPPDGKKIITVDSIRTMIAKLCESSVLEQGYVVIIQLCEQMNTGAYNALLKILEEPLSAHFILVSEQLYQLPQTIRSRCQTLFMAPATLAQTEHYLTQLGLSSELAPLLEGAPCKGQDYSDKAFIENRNQLFSQFLAVCEKKSCPLTFSDWLQRQDVNQMSTLLLSLIQDTLMVKLLADKAALTHVDMRQTVNAIALKFSRQGLLTVLDKMLGLANALAINQPINQGLWLDELLVTIWKS